MHWYELIEPAIMVTSGGKIDNKEWFRSVGRKYFEETGLVFAHNRAAKYYYYAVKIGCLRNWPVPFSESPPYRWIVTLSAASWIDLFTI